MSMTSAYFGEEFVVEDLIKWESVAGVFLQDACDEFLCGRGKRRWQVVPNFLYTLVGLLQVKSLKRRVAAHQCVPEWDKPKNTTISQLKIEHNDNLSGLGWDKMKPRQNLYVQIPHVILHITGQSKKFLAVQK